MQPTICVKLNSTLKQAKLLLIAVAQCFLFDVISQYRWEDKVKDSLQLQKHDLQQKARRYYQQFKKGKLTTTDLSHDRNKGKSLPLVLQSLTATLNLTEEIVGVCSSFNI